MCEFLESRQLLTLSPISGPFLSPDAPQIAVVADAAKEVLSPQYAAAALATEVTSSAPEATPLAITLPDSGVLVTPTQIITGHDTVPRFTAIPTVSAVASGDWSNPSIWSTGRVPGVNDRVQIEAGRSVTYALASPVSLDNMEIGGRLSFATNVNTSLKVGTLTVLPGGGLEIGTTQSPIAVGVKAELIIADRPLAVGEPGQPGIDPSQYGTGLLVFGTFTTRGAQASVTWSRLATEPRAGDLFLQLSESVTGWSSGSTIVLPDSRQVRSSQDWQFLNGLISPQWETAVIDSVVGSRVNLKQPLQFDHLGARNTGGTLELLPHVGLLDRNVVIRSENPNGTRGHTFYSASATVDIEYTRLADLGRTDALRSLDSTTKDAEGNITHIGTNQIGRYAVHFHHLFGPPNPTNSGDQYRFVGNTVDNFKKWGVAIHDSNFGLLDENVIYNGQGAGLVTEEGDELYNSITNNFALRIQGTGSDGKDGTDVGDYGRGGVGFWFRRSGNYISGNVAADTNYAGYVFSSYYAWNPIDAALARGLNPEVAGNSVTLATNPAGTFANNESYGMSASGLWAAYITGLNEPDSPQFTFQDLRIWNTNIHAGVVVYHTTNTAFDGLLILGDQAAQDRPDVGGTGFSTGYYENINLEIRNSRIEGYRYGIQAPVADGSTSLHEQPTIVRDSILKNYFNIVVRLKPDKLLERGNSLEVRNVRFGSVAVPSRTAEFSGPARNIVMKYALTENNDPANVIAPSVVRVYDYNQSPGNNFEVFYKEQDPNFVLPLTPSSALAGRQSALIGVPYADLTNQTAMATLGAAVAGGVSPTRDTAGHPEILGYTAPIQAATPARIAFLTPWDNAEVQGIQPVRVRYLVTGAQPVGSMLFFQLDGGTPFTTLTDGGLYGLSAGTHTLRAYFGNPQTGLKISATNEASVTFRVASPNQVTIGGASGAHSEGSPISLTSSTSGLVGQLSYQWTVTKNGQAFPMTNNHNASFRFTPNDNGTYLVSLTVKDSVNRASSASASIAVGNVAPVVSTATLNQTAMNEGGTLTVTGAVSDPGLADTHTVSIDWGDGSRPTSVWVNQSSHIYTASHRYLDDKAAPAADNFIIKITAKDDEQAASSLVTRTVRINNVAPTATILGLPTWTVSSGTTISLASLISDPGTRDTFTYTWTVKKNGQNFAVVNNRASEFAFTPIGNGIYAVKLTVTDDDGGVSVSEGSFKVAGLLALKDN